MDAMTPRQNVPAELLLDYASGAAPEPVALAMATYIDLNPQAEVAYRRLTNIGGALLEDIAPAPVNEDRLHRLLARLDAEPIEEPVTEAASTLSSLPSPLAPYVGDSIDSLRWKTLAPGVEEYVLPTSVQGFRTSLLRIAPGKAMPNHGHRGEEITVVIEGAYTAGGACYGRGDIEVADDSVEHKPVADADVGCLCLAVQSAPMRLTGVLGWVINPFLKV
jgi:putative transcriptional regulator